MIGATWDQVAMAFTKVRLEQFRSALRRRLLLKAGNAAKKVMLRAVKSQPIPEALGLLKSDIGAKAKAYAGSNTVFVIAGPKSKVTETELYKDYRTLTIRRGRNRRVNPAKYAHLAGPNRIGVFIPDARKQCRDEVTRVLFATLQEEVAKQ